MTNTKYNGYGLYKLWNTGVNIDKYVFPKKKPMSYSKNYSSTLKKLPQASTIINLVIIGVVGLVGYKAYKYLAPTPDDVANDNAAKQAATTKTSGLAQLSTKLTAIKNKLAAEGFYPSSLHSGLAESLYSKMNATFVNQTQIIQIIKGMSFQTLQLVAVSYGTRNLSTYANAHILDGDVWSFDNLFATDKMVGDLRTHIEWVLNSDNQRSVSSNVKFI
jgi:hypothetical protein